MKKFYCSNSHSTHRGFHAPFLKEFKNRVGKHMWLLGIAGVGQSYCDKKHEIAIKRSPIRLIIYEL